MTDYRNRKNRKNQSRNSSAFPMLRMAGVSFAAIAFMGTALAAHADVNAGIAAWEAGQYEKAVAEWREPALAGDMDAQYNLGYAYKKGQGVPMDLKIAADWFRKAAAQGHIRAADNYGLILFQQNERQAALPFIQASAERGEPRAQYVLGTLFFNGELVEKDWVKAYALMTRASAQGLPPATKSLGKMDQFIPLEKRQLGTQMAVSMEGKEQQLRSQQQLAQMKENASTTPAPVAATAPKAAPIANPVQTAQYQGAPAPARATSSPAQAVQPAQPVREKPMQTLELPPSRPAPAAAVSTPAPPAAPAPKPVMAKAQPAPAAAPPSYRPSVAAPAPAPSAASYSNAQQGGWRIQLGAFSSQSRARSAWASAENSYGSLIPHQPYIVDNGTLVKLQVGPFASESEAASTCARLKSKGQGCFAVKQ